MRLAACKHHLQLPAAPETDPAAKFTQWPAQTERAAHGASYSQIPRRQEVKRTPESGRRGGLTPSDLDSFVDALLRPARRQLLEPGRRAAPVAAWRRRRPGAPQRFAPRSPPPRPRGRQVVDEARRRVGSHVAGMLDLRVHKLAESHIQTGRRSDDLADQSPRLRSSSGEARIRSVGTPPATMVNPLNGTFHTSFRQRASSRLSTPEQSTRRAGTAPRAPAPARLRSFEFAQGHVSRRVDPDLTRGSRTAAMKASPPTTRSAPKSEPAVRRIRARSAASE